MPLSLYPIFLLCRAPGDNYKVLLEAREQVGVGPSSFAQRRSVPKPEGHNGGRPDVFTGRDSPDT